MSVCVASSKAKKISDVLKLLFATAGITDRAGLDAWCGKAGRERLYGYVATWAPEHWARVVDPKAATRGAYQTLLTGYGGDMEAASPPASSSPPVPSSKESPPAAALSPPAAPAPPSAEERALKLAEELVKAHEREIARLALVEAEALVLKEKAEVARLKRNEASRKSKAKARAEALDLKGAAIAVAFGETATAVAFGETATEDPVSA
jgi:hypothetical protein